MFESLLWAAPLLLLAAISFQLLLSALVSSSKYLLCLLLLLRLSWFTVLLSFVSALSHPPIQLKSFLWHKLSVWHHTDTSYLPRRFSNFLFTFFTELHRSLFKLASEMWSKSFVCVDFPFISRLCQFHPPVFFLIFIFSKFLILWGTFFPVIKPSELIFQVIFRPLHLCFTLQVRGAVWGCGLRDQPHPSSLLGGAAGVRPPAGTPSLQLCRTLPQIQTPLPLQGLPPRPGGAVQRLSTMTRQET